MRPAYPACTLPASVRCGTVDLTVFRPDTPTVVVGGEGAAMTATLPDVAAKKRQGKESVEQSAEQSADQQAAAELVRLAKEQGLSLTGPDGLLKQLTKTVLETALNEEMTEHLGHEKHGEPVSGNVRNGTRTKAVLTEATGHVQIDVPRDRAGTFEPRIVRKRQRRLSGVDEVVLSLYAKGLTTGEISAHFAEIYGASVSKETISRITDKVVEEMTEWAARPLDEVYAAIFIDAIVVKVRDGQVANRPFYAAIGVTLAGERDILGLWAGGAGSGEGAKFWMSVLTDLRNRGVRDVFLVVCDGLKGLPEIVSNVWAPAIVQTWHHPPDPQHLPAHLAQVLGRPETRSQADLHRGQRHRRPRRLRPARRQLGTALPRDRAAVGQRLGRVHLVPGLRRRDPPGDLQHQRHRVAECPLPTRGQARSHFPSEQAALKCLYLVTRSLDPTGTGRARWAMRWKPALNAFAITFGDRFPAAETY